MPEANDAQRLLSFEPKVISPVVLEKLSKGDVQLTPNMSIKGEGGNRRIYIIVEPDARFYIDHQTEKKNYIDVAQKIRHRLGDEDGAMDKTLDMMNSSKRKLVRAALFKERMQYSDNRMQYFIRQFGDIINDPDAVSLERGQEFIADCNAHEDLTDYMESLIQQDKLELILPEQKADQAVVAGATET